MHSTLSFEIGAQPPEDDDRFETFYAAYIAEADSEAANRASDRDAVREQIMGTHRQRFEAMELLHEAAAEAINWASKTVHDSLSEGPEDNAFASHFNVLIGLGGRALLAFDEVSWLLRGGYSSGAWTRTRSLQEAFVVAATLGLHGDVDGSHPDLAERYKRHHEVFTPKTARDLLATGNHNDVLTNDILVTLDRKRKTLLEKYGKTFATAWGWAAPLFPNQTPTFTALSELVLSSFSVFYGIASSHLHAGSQGLIEATVTETDGSETFMAGAEAAGLGAPATLASGFLLGVLGTIVPTSITLEGSAEEDKTGHYFLGALTRIHDRIASESQSESESGS